MINNSSLLFARDSSSFVPNRVVIHFRLLNLLKLMAFCIFSTKFDVLSLLPLSEYNYDYILTLNRLYEFEWKKKTKECVSSAFP